jgi:succinoglycan biosynthesis protein ExoM
MCAKRKSERTENEEASSKLRLYDDCQAREARDGEAGSMSEAENSITVCVCTFRRVNLLLQLLERLTNQKSDGAFAYNIVISDNDGERSAQRAVTEFNAESAIDVTYCCQPEQNIALARNEALKYATGNFIAFIDDDELPEHDWLAKMLAACNAYQASGVLAPVRPRFEEPPPRWAIEGAFFERPENPTGTVLRWEDCRTGNLLFRRAIIDGVTEVFRPEFGTGGEDKDFFLRMTRLGHVFRWCSEGAVYEVVPKDRVTRRYLLKRALLRGRNNLKLPVSRARLLGKSLIATPAYLIALPFALLRGQHVFMKYCIKFCDHAGRLLALMNLNPVRDR